MKGSWLKEGWGALRSVCLCFLGRTGFACDSLKSKGPQACYREMHQKPGDGGRSVMDAREGLTEGLRDGCHSSLMMQWERGGARRRVGRTSPRREREEGGTRKQPHFSEEPQPSQPTGSLFCKPGNGGPQRFRKSMARIPGSQTGPVARVA